jgi:hypothetical protein
MSRLASKGWPNRAPRIVAVGLIFEVGCAKERGPLVNQRILRLKISIAVLDASKIDHSDRPEATEGHHANHNIDDIGPDQRREDEDQSAAVRYPSNAVP